MQHETPQKSTQTVPSASRPESGGELNSASLRILRLNAGEQALTTDERDRLDTAERNERIDLLMAESTTRVQQVRAELLAELARLKAADEKRRKGRQLVREILRGTGRSVTNAEADVLAADLAKQVAELDRRDAAARAA